MRTTEAAKEAIWLKKLLDGLNIPEPLPIPIYYDNQSSILMTLDQRFHTKTKPIETRHHFIRQQVENGQIRLVYCSTNHMIADFFNKAVNLDKHHYCSEQLQILS
jgi:hypothetical protein